MNNIQNLYNKLLIKKELGMGDVVARLSFTEVEVLLKGLMNLGASEKEGNAVLEALKSETEKTLDKHESELLKAYEGLRVKVLTGKHKNRIGFISIVNSKEKKPINVAFANGGHQKYTTLQIKVIEKDMEKFNKQMEEILK